VETVWNFKNLFLGPTKKKYFSLNILTTKHS
jgi:hypothetical protein